MSALVTRKTWPYATNSTGRHRGSLNLGFLVGRVQVYEAIGAARAIYMDLLGQEVVKYLNDNGATLQESGCSVDLSLFMVGKSLLRTKPMLMFVSNDKATRLEAFNMIKRSAIMDGYPGFGLGHMELRAEFENLQALAGQAGSTGPIDRSSNPKPVSHPAKLRVYTSDFGCLSGARLFTNGNGDLRLQSSATAGGIVSFGGCYMAHTVNHFLDAGTRAHDKPVPSAIGTADAPDGEVTGLSDFEDDGEDVLTDITSRGSMTPKSTRSRSTSSPTDENKTVDGQTSSVISGDIVTARDDFLVSVDERLECLTPSLPSSPPVTTDLLDVGDVVTSSSALDYCLIRIDNKYASMISPEDRASPTSDAVPLENYLERIEATPRDAAIRTTKLDGGIIGGTLSGTTSFVRLPGSRLFQEVYTGKLNTPPVPGDCGSWIRDAVSGKLYGHVISGSPTTGLIMVMPARHSFADALKTLTANEYSRSTKPVCNPDQRRPVSEAVNPMSCEPDAAKAVHQLIDNPRESTSATDGTASTRKDLESTPVHHSEPDIWPPETQLVEETVLQPHIDLGFELIPANEGRAPGEADVSGTGWMYGWFLAAKHLLTHPVTGSVSKKKKVRRPRKFHHADSLYHLRDQLQESDQHKKPSSGDSPKQLSGGTMEAGSEGLSSGVRHEWDEQGTVDTSDTLAAKFAELDVAMSSPHTGLGEYEDNYAVDFKPPSSLSNGTTVTDVTALTTASTAQSKGTTSTDATEVMTLAMSHSISSGTSGSKQLTESTLAKHREELQMLSPGDMGAWLEGAGPRSSIFKPAHQKNGKRQSAQRSGALEAVAEDGSYDIVPSPETKTSRDLDLIAAGQLFDEERFNPYMYTSQLDT